MTVEINKIIALGSELHKKQIHKVLKFNWNKDVKKLKYPSSAALPAIQTLKKKIEYPIELTQNEMLVWWKTIESWLDTTIELPNLTHKRYKINSEDDFCSLYSMLLNEISGLGLAQIFNLKHARDNSFVTMISCHKNTNKGRIADSRILSRISKESIIITKEGYQLEQLPKNVKQIIITKEFSINNLEQLLIEDNFCSEKE